MTKNEIINSGIYYQQNEKEPLAVFRISIYVPFFEKEIPVEAFNLQNLEDVSVQMNLLVDTINEIIAYDKINLEWIKDQVWLHFNSYMTNSSYNMVDYSGFANEEAANRAFFNVSNRDEAYKKVALKNIHFDLSQTDYRHFNLCFKCPWEQEHGITICVINGEFGYME